MTHTPGPLERAFRDSLPDGTHIPTCSDWIPHVRAIWRHLDTMSKPEVGIPTTPAESEALRISVRALERLAAGDNMGVLVPTEDSPKHAESFQRVALTALSRIKALSNG